MMVFMMVLMTGIAKGGTIVQGGAATAGMGTIKVDVADTAPDRNCKRCGPGVSYPQLSMHCPDDNGNERRRWAMEKKLSCRAMGLNCAFVATDESEKEIVRKLADHLKTVHAIELTEELRKKANDLIRLVEA